MKIVSVYILLAMMSIAGAIICSMSADNFSGIKIAAPIFAQYCFIAAAAIFIFFALVEIVKFIGRL